jgi:hypothetical protein
LIEKSHKVEAAPIKAVHLRLSIRHVLVVEVELAVSSRARLESAGGPEYILHDIPIGRKPRLSYVMS